QLLGQGAVAEDADLLECPDHQPAGLERRRVHDRAGVEHFEVADVDDRLRLIPGGVAEPTLRDAAAQRRLAPLEQPPRHARPRAGVLALGPEPGGLALPGADPAADPPLELPLLDAGRNLREVHYRATPRSRATSSRVRSCKSPLMVAFTRLIGLVLPCTLVRMLVIPQAWSTSRTPGPAFTPVPGPAGTRT